MDICLFLFCKLDKQINFIMVKRGGTDNFKEDINVVENLHVFNEFCLIILTHNFSPFTYSTSRTVDMKPK
jgi:hypothetical protein